MIKFDQLKSLHLEITNNCQASCPMCNRNINGGRENPLIKIRNWSLDNFTNILSKEVLEQIEHFYFCGNFGDPILNNDLISMCRYSSLVAPNVRIGVHTNGGARSAEWWADLTNVLPERHLVTFAIDGLEDTHSLYRVGTKFKKVTENARSFIRAGGLAEWVFIKFKHNEHQVEQARELASKWGFEKFTVKNSSRFILEPKVKVVDSSNKVTHYIEPSSEVTMKFIDKKIIQAYKEITSMSEINCKVRNDQEVYIDAYGDLYPCCWIASVPYSYISIDDAYEVRHEMLRQHWDLMNSLGDTNTLTRSVKDIINSNEYQTVWDNYWNKDKLITCARTCGVNTSFAKPRDQLN
jgi:MoaA/NifB/PqqE/SkfB family radical SAM enzyme